MEEQQTESPPSAKKSSKDRWVKLAFIVVVLAALIFLALHQRKGPELKGWKKDLPAALREAKETNRPVLVYFTSGPRSHVGEWNVRNTLRKPENRKAIKEGNYIRVEAKLSTSLDSETAKKYRITDMPTMLLLAPDGKERNRRVGKIGEMDFTGGFLDCKKIEKPRGS